MIHLRAFLPVLLLAIVCVEPLQAQINIPEAPVRYDDDLLSPAFHESRRAAVRDELPSDAVAVFFSSPVQVRENDVDFEYRQDSNLYYLTGATEPGTVLLLAPGGITVEGASVNEVLLVPPRDPERETWTGRLLGPERAQEQLGIEAAVSNELFEGLMQQLQRDGRAFYRMALPEGVAPSSDLGQQLATFARYAEAPDEVLLPRLLTQLRMEKTPAELRLLRRAIDITAEAQREAMRSIEPGMYEYEAEALIEYVFKRNGAEYPGFPSIIGSGENSVILHYNTSRRQMEDGDLVVMDIGAEVHGYSADVTRTVPVSGTFSPEQRQIYELVLRAQETGIQAARAGRPFGAPGEVARRVIAEGLMQLGLIDNEEEVSRFFMHSTSHYLGLWVHDVGDYGTLQPNQVITVEPGIYIAPAPDVDRRWWNIGVRIEDDILITNVGPVNLSEGAPRTVAAIEQLMQETGLGNEPAGLLDTSGSVLPR